MTGGCPHCELPAEEGHTHCCKKCRKTEGRGHSSRCPGRDLWRQFTSTYRPSPIWTRGPNQDLLEFIHWFYPDGPSFPHDPWRRLEWTFSRIDRTRRVELVPLCHSTKFPGTVVDCLCVDARGPDMSRVTGVDIEVVRSACRSEHITTVLRDAVELIETYRLSVIGFRCRSGTHRSVVVINLLMMCAYPEAVCRPLTPRVQEAAAHRWRIVAGDSDGRA